jgi:hypothetical protein
MFHYSVYGVVLASDTPLPELQPSITPSENIAHKINVNLGEKKRRCPDNIEWLLSSVAPNGEQQAASGKIAGGYLLRSAGLADFIVDQHGREVQCTHICSATAPALLRHLLLDRVLPLVLNLRGEHVLHATAVLTPAGICAFIGPAGAGKSTLAASMNIAGCESFCDDCLVLHVDGEVIATPGYPGIRLWNDSLAALGGRACQKVCLSENGKWRLITADKNPAEMVPENPGYWRSCVDQFGSSATHRLIAIYRVSRAADTDTKRSAVELMPLTSSEAFMELVSASVLLDVHDRGVLSRHFRFIEQLIARARIRRLTVPNDFSRLSSVCQAVLQDVQL